MIMNTIKKMFLLTAVLAACSGLAGAASSDPLHDAVAAWHFRGLDDSAGANSALEIQGAVTVGEEMDGPAEAASKARGGDGYTVDCAGGFLVAGQGAGGELNLNSSAMSLYARLRNPTGDWATTCGIVSMHGGRDRLTYNLYANNGNLGFELGTDQGLFRVQTLARHLGNREWHDVVVRYDGHTLEMFVDGVPVSERPASGKLRTGNAEPLILAGWSNNGKPRGPFKGKLDTVALWNRSLDDAEVVALSGGEEVVAAKRLEMEQARYEGLPEPHANYLRNVQSKDKAVFGKAALDLRLWLEDNDPHRPVYHTMGPMVFTFDVNGPIYYEGQYHLFYLNARFGHNCVRGHLVSSDLVHWTDWPVAMWRTHLGRTRMCSRGTA